MKKVIYVVLAVILLSSCANNKTLMIDGQETVVEPYGLFNEESRRVEGVVYEASLGNVLLGVVLIETVVFPIYVGGWCLWEPVSVKKEVKEKL